MGNFVHCDAEARQFSPQAASDNHRCYLATKNGNDMLYRKCNTHSLSTAIRQARWGLFGHILRLPRNAPAQIVADHYLKNGESSWRGRPQCTLPAILKDHLKKIGMKLTCESDLAKLRATASCHHVIMSSCHHVIMSSCHHVIMSAEMEEACWDYFLRPLNKYLRSFRIFILVTTL